MSGSAGLLNKKILFCYLVGSPKVGGAGDGKHKKKYGHPNSHYHVTIYDFNCNMCFYRNERVLIAICIIMIMWPYNTDHISFSTQNHLALPSHFTRPYLD